MGILDKLKTWLTGDGDNIDKSESNEVEEEIVEKERKYIFLIEEVEEIDDSDALALIGYVHGEIHVEDKIYVHKGEHKAQLAIVAGLQTSPGNSVDEAADARIGMKVNGLAKNMLDPFSVVSSIPPNFKLDEKENIENPRLRGLLAERKRLKDTEFFCEELYAELDDSQFLMAIYFDSEYKTSESHPEEKVMVGNEMMNMPLMSNPDDEGKKLVPIFTHWDAIERWKDVYDENKPQVMIVNLFDARTIAGGLNGEIIVNPFSDDEIRLSEDVLKEVLQQKD